MSTNENKGKKAEVTALQAISAEDRKDWISLAFVQAGICVCVPAFLLGALLAEAMPIWPAIISGSLGYLIVVSRVFYWLQLLLQCRLFLLLLTTTVQH